MRVESLPGMTNVIRFPVERRARPTLDLLREIAPDVREVLLIADAFDLDTPASDLRARVDQETAEHILNTYDDMTARQPGVLDQLLQPVVAEAIEACREAHDVSVAAAQAQETFLGAQTSGGFWLDPLRERAEALSLRAAERLLEAHTRAEQAFGVARAVDLAKRGENWTPRDMLAEDDALLSMGRRQLG